MLNYVGLSRKNLLYMIQTMNIIEKRQPSEICWESVAEETGVSVDKCKRRWRQIRSDYIANRNAPNFPMAEELAFLNAHLPASSELSTVGEKDTSKKDNESERDSKSKSKEPSVELSYKEEEFEDTEAVEEQPLSKLKQTTLSQKQTESEQDKIKPKDKKVEQKKEAKNKRKYSEYYEKEEEHEAEDKKEAAKLEQPQRLRLDSNKSEFFIKQSSKTTPNCLIIGKKQPTEDATTEPPQLADDHFDSMADESPDETASVGGGRRLRRGPARKQLPIQKTVSEQRITRLSRRKSLSVAAALRLRSSTSPVKMTPLPRTIATSPKAAKVGQPAAATAAAAAPSRDDIFPRPRAAPPAVVMARRPGQQLTQSPLQISSPTPSSSQSPAQPSTTAASATAPLMRQIIKPRPVPGTRPTVPAPIAAKRFAVPTVTAPRAPPPHSLHNDPLKLPPASKGATSSSPPQQQRLVSSSNTLVISTTSYPTASSNTTTMSSSSGTSSSIGSGSNTGLTTSITASAIASTTTLVKRLEKCSQTDTADVFSDDYFLDMVRPQMREMNSRQKMRFKQKIFNALMETFDDATDFPDSGDLQHFNINTPSGYENVSDVELRLMRELVSIVSAAKHTPETTSTVATALILPTVAKNATPVAAKPQGAVAAASPAATASSAKPNLDEKRMYRIMPMANGVKVPMTMLRQDSIDSNSSTARSTPGIATVTGAAAAAARAKFVIPAKSPRILDPLTTLLTTVPQAGNANKVTAAAATVTTGKDPMLVRQMGRRYSICGGVGPSATLANSQTAAASVGAVNGSLEAMLKRRLPNVTQSMVPPQQRPRYSQSPTGHIAPGNSLLVRRAAVAGAQKQVSPQGGMPLTQKSPQLSGNTGFNSFATPTTLQRVTSPQKRGMVIANVKGQGQQQAKSSVAAVRAAAPLGQIKSTSSPNVANLLSDSRPNMSNPAQRPPAPAQTSQATTAIAIQSQPHSQPAKAAAVAAAAAAAKTAAAAEQREETQTAGIIAADYFDMSRLKREPQDILDDDILGM
ncbi:mucin-2 [Drosophila nasuta]|uniref:mucin-2 n=1 Tax=Drosophila nasuta TaxID=42062 RepID=UPI00295E25A9|nr:mucin-2 [Drosophila nasuta]